MTLTEFLLARIAEDEATAAAASSGPWRWVVTHYPDGSDDDCDLQSADMWATKWGFDTAEYPVSVITATGMHTEGYVECSPENREHIARFDPARALSECKAKRQIIAEHGTIRAAYPGCTIESDPCCETCSCGGVEPGRHPCLTMRLLALPYADHPDYDPEWRP